MPFCVVKTRDLFGRSSRRFIPLRIRLLDRRSGSQWRTSEWNGRVKGERLSASADGHWDRFGGPSPRIQKKSSPKKYSKKHNVNRAWNKVAAKGREFVKRDHDLEKILSILQESCPSFIIDCFAQISLIQLRHWFVLERVDNGKPNLNFIYRHSKIRKRGWEVVLSSRKGFSGLIPRQVLFAHRDDWWNRTVIYSRMWLLKWRHEPLQTLKDTFTWNTRSPKTSVSRLWKTSHTSRAIFQPTLRKPFRFSQDPTVNVMCCVCFAIQFFASSLSFQLPVRGSSVILCPQLGSDWLLKERYCSRIEHR